jgi:hypothetical protein
MPIGSAGGNPFRNIWNTTQGAIPTQTSTSTYENQLMMSQKIQFPCAGQGHGVFQNPGQQPNFSWKLGASKNLGSLFSIHSTQLKLLFMTMLHLLDLSILLNKPICHDPCCPPMPTKFPSDIPKFEGKPNEDPGDQVTTFHLWCSSKSMRDDFVQFPCFNSLLSRVPRNGTSSLTTQDILTLVIW